MAGMWRNKELKFKSIVPKKTSGDIFVAGGGGGTWGRAPQSASILCLKKILSEKFSTFMFRDPQIKVSGYANV